MQYSLVWMTKYLTAGSRGLDDMAARLEAAAAELRELRAAGVTLEPDGADDGFPRLTTDDPQVAERYGFEPPEEEDD